ncbi:PAS domain-containing hybrid sensor histidine kinase/response regulator [Anaerolentibacter hominis]|uniref:PAS domain-containing hybrid sensor histidine kinase/response regulator n=1 Tax=Anaerolentibacter hominis TaxID=3079009 RepID=UPI0031B8725B
MEQQYDAGHLNHCLNSRIAHEYNRMFGKSNMGILCYLPDKELTLLWANESFYRKTGYTREEFAERFPAWKDYYADRPDAFAVIKTGVMDSMKPGQEGFAVTVPFPVEEGHDLWMRVSGNVTEERINGLPVCYAVHTDISNEIKLREEQHNLQSEKSRYFEWMMEEYAGNIYICDMNSYELLYLNHTAADALYEITRLRRSDILGRKCYEVIQGRTTPCPFCTNDRITEEEFYEWEFYNPNLERTFMIKNRVINWYGHRARIELSHDMYSAEYKLAKKDREREAIIRTIPGGFARVDARDMRTILWYGGGFLDLIGYTKEEFEKELDCKCGYIHPDDVDRVISVMEGSKEAGRDTIAEARIVTRRGDIKILTMTFSYVRGEDSWDGLSSFYSVGIDVTQDRKEQERQRQALEEAYRAARVASSAKTNFLSSMSHDIRTPMNAIMGMTAIAQANLHSEEKVEDCLNKINVSSRHLLSLINEVLDMSKIESGKIDLVPENIDLSQLIQSVVDMCRPLIEEKQQQFDISAGTVRHEKVVADGDRLRQVLMNLMSNAIKYTPEKGRISLQINELLSANPQKGQYEFIMEDNGVGMAAEFLPHIFEPFSRAEDTRISKIQGTGLGMAITENVVRMMNGTIEVKSYEGQGSRFTVSVPLALQEEESLDNRLLTGKPVLIVDDDQIVCESAAIALNEMGIQSFWVLSGTEAVERIAKAHEEENDFYAVILDWKMPDKDGLETVKAIRRQADIHVPIIIISAYDYSAIKADFLRAGADAFITKPLFKSKLLHILQTFTTGSSMKYAPIPEMNQHSRLQGRHVLLVEDNDLNREIAAELLSMQGIHVDTAVNGKEAVEQFAASAPGEYDAVLMDIQMPVMNGYDATAAIRSLKRDDSRSVPILALTANAFTSDVGKARSAGMNDHIAKPIDVKLLMETLLKWMK